MRVVLVRHCESSGPAPEAPLTVRGRAQAVELARRLSPLGIDHIVSSPYARARATIQPFADLAGLPVQVDERLAERRLSPQPIDNWRDFVRSSFEDPDSRAAGGESGRETLARGWAAIESILQQGHQLPAVVSHGQLLSLVLHSLDPGFGFAGWESMRNPEVFLLEHEGDNYEAGAWHLTTK
jgi:2,3-bisphosphoglycerate-dependent phosphoglycerate mutase